jgi:hypothetical protein
MESGFHLFLRSVTVLREKIADFQTYPFTVPAIRELEFLYFDSPVTFFVRKIVRESPFYLRRSRTSAGELTNIIRINPKLQNPTR